MVTRKGSRGCARGLLSLFILSLAAVAGCSHQLPDEGVSQALPAPAAQAGAELQSGATAAPVSTAEVLNVPRREFLVEAEVISLPAKVRDELSPELQKALEGKSLVPCSLLVELLSQDKMCLIARPRLLVGDHEVGTFEAADEDGQGNDNGNHNGSREVSREDVWFDLSLHPAGLDDGSVQLSARIGLINGHGLATISGARHLTPRPGVYACFPGLRQGKRDVFVFVNLTERNGN